MKKFIPLFLFVVLAACNPFAAKEMKITDAYSVETPKTFPAAAVFMTIENNTDIDDRMVGFKTDRAARVELHTMDMANDVMRMRRVDDYTIATGESHTLKPGGDHVMLFGMNQGLVEGEAYDGVAVFEKAGEIPVTVTVRPRENKK